MIDLIPLSYLFFAIAIIFTLFAWWTGVIAAFPALLISSAYMQDTHGITPEMAGIGLIFNDSFALYWFIFTSIMYAFTTKTGLLTVLVHVIVAFFKK